MPSRFLFPRRRHRKQGSEFGVSTDALPHDTPSSIIAQHSNGDDVNHVHNHHHGHGHHRHHHLDQSSMAAASDVNWNKSQPPQQILGPIQNFRLRSIDRHHNECAVCAKPFEVDCVICLLPCGHYFCKACTIQWFNRAHATTCPLCRYDVVDAGSSSEDKNDDKGYHVMQDTTTTDSTSEIRLNQSTFCIEVDGAVSVCQGGQNFVEQKTSRTSAVSANFDLIMSKALHARRASGLVLLSWNSTLSSDDE